MSSCSLRCCGGWKYLHGGFSRLHRPCRGEGHRQVQARPSGLTGFGKVCSSDDSGRRGPRALPAVSSLTARVSQPPTPSPPASLHRVTPRPPRHKRFSEWQNMFLALYQAFAVHRRHYAFLVWTAGSVRGRVIDVKIFNGEFPANVHGNRLICRPGRGGFYGALRTRECQGRNTALAVIIRISVQIPRHIFSPGPELLMTSAILLFHLG